MGDPATGPPLSLLLPSLTRPGFSEPSGQATSPCPSPCPSPLCSHIWDKNSQLWEEGNAPWSKTAPPPGLAAAPFQPRSRRGALFFQRLAGIFVGRSGKPKKMEPQTPSSLATSTAPVSEGGTRDSLPSLERSQLPPLLPTWFPQAHRPP